MDQQKQQGPEPGWAAPYEKVPGVGEALCPHCNGTGQIATGKCPDCDGTGIVTQPIGGA